VAIASASIASGSGPEPVLAADLRWPSASGVRRGWQDPRWRHSCSAFLIQPGNRRARGDRETRSYEPTVSLIVGKLDPGVLTAPQEPSRSRSKWSTHTHDAIEMVDTHARRVAVPPQKTRASIRC
jgi:hypothetical protein